jgi:glutamyl-tRNA reductase
LKTECVLNRLEKSISIDLLSQFLVDNSNIYKYEIRQNELLKDEYKNYDIIIFGTSSNISKFNIEEEEIKKGIREKKIRIIMK